MEPDAVIRFPVPGGADGDAGAGGRRGASGVPGGAAGSPGGRGGPDDGLPGGPGEGPPPERRRRWRVWALGFAALAVAAAAPHLLRRLDAFDVRRVAVLGTRWLPPHEALAASGIGAGANVFDDAGPWRAALLRHPLVADARIERQLPATLVLHVTEVEPVAFARTPDLAPVDAAGRVLPIDPAGLELDLPVLATPSAVEDGVLADSAARAVAALLGRLRALEPGLAARVSEAHAARRGGARMLLREPAGAEVLLPAEAGSASLGQLRLALADLAARRELDRVLRLDARFRDQVVVSLNAERDAEE